MPKYTAKRLDVRHRDASGFYRVDKLTFDTDNLLEVVEALAEPECNMFFGYLDEKEINIHIHKEEWEVGFPVMVTFDRKGRWYFTKNWWKMEPNYGILPPEYEGK